jgi:hypothetical protein
MAATPEFAGEGRGQSARRMMLRTAEVLADVAMSVTLSENAASTLGGLQ